VTLWLRILMMKVEFTAPEVGKWAPTVESGDLVRALQGREVAAPELRRPRRSINWYLRVL
jgi:hypothetical protein